MEEEYYKLYLGKNFLDTTPKPQLTIKKKKKRSVIDMVSGERKRKHIKWLIKIKNCSLGIRHRCPVPQLVVNIILEAYPM